MPLKERVVNIQAFAAIIILLPLSAPLTAESGIEPAVSPDTVFADRFQHPGTPPPTEKPIKPEPAGDFSLEVASYWGGPIKGGDVHGDYAYIANGPMLRILDISDETNLVEIGAIRLGTAGTVNDVKVRGDYAFVAANAGDYFSIVDISDPSQPVKIRSFEQSTSGGRSAQEVVLYGDYAYVRDIHGTGGAIRVYHIKNPVNATAAGQITESDIDTTSMVIHDGYLYAGQRGGDSGALEIYDLSVDPANPPLIYEWASHIVFGPMAALDDRLYASVDVPDSHNGNRLMTMDISSPDSPIITGLISWGRVVDVANSLTIMNGYLFKAVEYSSPNAWQHVDSLQIYDLTTPDQPELMGGYKPHGAVQHVLDIGVDRLYAADAAEGFVILDTTELSVIHSVGNYHSPAVLRRALVDGDLLYVTDAYGGFTVLDVSNPDSPMVVGNYLARRHDVAGIDAFGIDKAGDIVYLAAGGAGLLTVDVSDPTQPVTLGTMRISSMTFPSNPWCGARFRELKVRHGIAHIGYRAHFCSSATNWILTADVSDPSLPVALDVDSAHSWGYAGGAPTDMHFGPQDSLLVDSGPELIFSVSDPENPELIFGPGSLRHFTITVAQDLKASLVSFRDNLPGLHLHDISNPKKPVRLHWLEMETQTACGRFMGPPKTDSAVAFGVDSGRLYVLNGNTWSADADGTKWGASIFVFDISDSGDPICMHRFDFTGSGALPRSVRLMRTAPPHLLAEEPSFYFTSESNGLAILSAQVR